MTAEKFRELALSFPGAVEAQHFDRIAFRSNGKPIFATLHEISNTVNLKLSIIDQSVFSSFDKDTIYPVANKWGLQGWTTFELTRMTEELMLDALTTAYEKSNKPRRRA